MEKIPNTIWLQYHGDQKPNAGEVVSVRDVTWSAHKEFALDIGPYVLRSELEGEIVRLREALIIAHEHACPSRAYRAIHEQRIHNLISALPNSQTHLNPAREG